MKKRVWMLALTIALLMGLCLPAMAAEEDTAYNAIYQAALNLADEVDIARFNLPPDSVEKIFCQILEDHPELFYLNGMLFGIGSDACQTKVIFRNTANSNTMYIEQYANPATVADFNRAMEKVLVDALGSVDGAGLTDLQKCLALHDWLAVNCSYDYDTANTPLEELLQMPEDPDTHTAYGPIMQRNTVCAGFARAYIVLLSQVGIKAGLVYSEPMAHSWNWVLLDGRYYHVDITWDNGMNTVNGKGSDLPGWVGHRYFLVSSDGFPYETENGRYDHYGYNTSGFAGIDPDLCWSNQYESGHIFNGSQVMSFFPYNGDLYYYESGTWKIAPEDLRGTFTGNDYAGLGFRELEREQVAVLEATRTLAWFSPVSGRIYEAINAPVEDLYFKGLSRGLYTNCAYLVQLNGTKTPTELTWYSMIAEYKITFDPCGGTTTETVRYLQEGEAYGSAYYGGAMPEAVKTGDVFLGWTSVKGDPKTLVYSTTTAAPHDTSDYYDGDRTLYALWRYSSFADWSAEEPRVLRLPGNGGGAVPAGSIIYAARYEASGRMAGVLKGELSADGSQVTFAQPLSPGWKVYFLSESLTPLREAVTVEG